MLIGNEEYCDYQTIQEAVDAVEKQVLADEKVTLHILEGVYQEQVVISRSHITLIGLGNVVISQGAYAKQTNASGNEIGTFATATLYLDGMDVHLINLTIENTAGQGDEIGQALALYANCDLSTFTNCRFIGSQDTLFTSCLPEKQKDGTDFPVNRPVHSDYRQYYLNCVIEGTVDYIFGGATAYFDQCLLINKARLIHEPGYITAANTPQEKKHGFIFNQCIIQSEDADSMTYLGRPWRPYAKVQFQDCKMAETVPRDRWHDWNNPANRETAQLIEIESNQPGFSKNYSSNWGREDCEIKVRRLSLDDVFSNEFYVRKGMKS